MPGRVDTTTDEFVYLADKTIKSIGYPPHFIMGIDLQTYCQVTFAFGHIFQVSKQTFHGGNDHARQDKGDQRTQCQTDDNDDGNMRVGTGNCCLAAVCSIIYQLEHDIAEAVDGVAHRIEGLRRSAKTHFDRGRASGTGITGTLCIDFTGELFPDVTLCFICMQFVTEAIQCEQAGLPHDSGKFAHALTGLINVLRVLLGQRFEIIAIHIHEDHAAFRYQGLVQIAISLQQVIHCGQINPGQLVGFITQMFDLEHGIHRHIYEQRNQYSQRQHQLETKRHIMKPTHSLTPLNM